MADRSSWYIERRLDFIDAMLAAWGSIGRGEIVAAFGVTPSQASADLAEFDRCHPGAIRYDHAGKRYLSAGCRYHRRRQVLGIVRATLELILAG